MKKPPLRILISGRKQELRAAHPKSRDRIRHRLQALQMAAKLKLEFRRNGVAA